MAGAAAVDTEHAHDALCLLSGEHEILKTMKAKGAIHREERTLLVTNQRVMFLWCKYNTTLCTYSREESFSLEDLKWVSIGSKFNGCFRKPSMTLSLNFSRDKCIISEWQALGGIGGMTGPARMSGTIRHMKLRREAAQEAYNKLQALMHERAAADKASCK